MTPPSSSHRTVVFYDTEFTTWEGAMEADWSLPGQYRELVQIGALRFDLDAFRIIDEFCVTIKPVKNPVLSDYFIHLTGITNDDVARDGLDYPEGYKKLTGFIGNDLAVSHGGDCSVINENNSWHNLPQNFTGLDIYPWFQTHGARFGIRKETNSGKLAALLNVPIDAIQEHNALHDVRSIAAGYTFLIRQGAPDFFA